MTKR
ncbi:bdad6f23-79ed-4a38-b377-2124b07dee21 [Thermothielavioides terrestris]|jgi:hypothetical protein